MLVLQCGTMVLAAAYSLARSWCLTLVMFASLPLLVIATVTGADLVGRGYTPPFSYYADHERAFRVVAADFVTTTDGTSQSRISTTAELRAGGSSSCARRELGAVGGVRTSSRRAETAIPTTTASVSDQVTHHSEPGRIPAMPTTASTLEAHDGRRGGKRRGQDGASARAGAEGARGRARRRPRLARADGLGVVATRGNRQARHGQPFSRAVTMASSGTTRLGGMAQTPRRGELTQPPVCSAERWW